VSLTQAPQTARTGWPHHRARSTACWASARAPRSSACYSTCGPAATYRGSGRSASPSWSQVRAFGAALPAVDGPRSPLDAMHARRCLASPDAGFTSLDPKYQACYSAEPLAVPTLHIYGDGDTHVVPCAWILHRTRAGDMCTNGVDLGGMQCFERTSAQQTPRGHLRQPDHLRALGRVRLGGRTTHCVRARSFIRIQRVPSSSPSTGTLCRPMPSRNPSTPTFWPPRWRHCRATSSSSAGSVQKSNLSVRVQVANATKETILYSGARHTQQVIYVEQYHT